MLRRKYLEVSLCIGAYHFDTVNTHLMHNGQWCLSISMWNCKKKTSYFYKSSFNIALFGLAVISLVRITTVSSNWDHLKSYLQHSDYSPLFHRETLQKIWSIILRFSFENVFMVELFKQMFFLNNDYQILLWIKKASHTSHIFLCINTHRYIIIIIVVVMVVISWIALI